MNKRQRKKNEKRHYERMGKMLVRAQKEMIHFWCTHKPENEQETRLIQHNLRCYREMVISRWRLKPRSFRWAKARMRERRDSVKNTLFDMPVEEKRNLGPFSLLDAILKSPSGNLQSVYCEKHGHCGHYID